MNNKIFYLFLPIIALIFWNRTALAEELLLPGTSTPVSAICKVLPWDFSVTTAENGDDALPPPPEQTVVSDDVFQFSSTRPCLSTDLGDIFMHLKLTVFQFTTKEDTDKALAHYYAQADPKSGITNAWDFLIGQENFLYYLHGDCTFSTGAFTAIANELKKIMHNTGSPSKEYILCKCGGGCIRQ